MKLAFKMDPQHGFPQLRDRFNRIKWLTEIGYHAQLDKVLGRMRGMVAELTPKATGATAAGWEAKSFGGGPKGRSGYLGVVRNRLAQGRGRRGDFYKMLLMILEYGSSHRKPILPKGKERGGSDVLVFESDRGEIIFTKRVEHPGTAPKAMVRRTAAQSNYWLRDVLKEIQRLYARDWGG